MKIFSGRVEGIFPMCPIDTVQAEEHFYIQIFLNRKNNHLIKLLNIIWGTIL